MLARRSSGLVLGLLAVLGAGAPHLTHTLIWYLDYGGDTIQFPAGQVAMNHTGVMGLTMDATAKTASWMNVSAQYRAAVVDPPDQVTWFVRPTSDWDLCQAGGNDTVKSVLEAFKSRLDAYLKVVCFEECLWGLGMAAEDDKQWTCNGAIVPGSDFRYILFGGYRSVYPEDSRLLLDIQGGGDQGYPLLPPDTPVSAVAQAGCAPDEPHCVYPNYHLMESGYEPYNLQGGDDPHACKDMADGKPLQCCDGKTVCKNEAGVSCKIEDSSGYSSLLLDVLQQATGEQQDKNVSLIPCVAASSSNADCALQHDSMLASALAKLPPLSPVCWYGGGV